MLKVSIVTVILLWLLGVFSSYAIPWYLHAVAFLTAGFLLMKQLRLHKGGPPQRASQSESWEHHRYTI